MACYKLKSSTLPARARATAQPINVDYCFYLFVGGNWFHGGPGLLRSSSSTDIRTVQDQVITLHLTVAVIQILSIIHFLM